MGVSKELLSVITFSYVKKSDVSAVYENALKGEVTVSLNGGVEWSQLQLTAGSMLFGESRKDDGDSGPYYVQEFTGNLPAKNALARSVVKSLVNEPVIVKMEMMNGEVLVVGNTTFPVKLEYNMATQDHHYVIQFSRRSKHETLRVAA